MENNLATLTKKDRRNILAGALGLARIMANFPVSSMLVDYDAEVDVLYISFQRPQKATDTVEEDDGSILVHYRGKEIVGITILDASKR
jgi:uncharacterized protein YuzE